MSQGKRNPHDRDFSGLSIVSRVEDSLGNECRWSQFHALGTTVSIVNFARPGYPLHPGKTFAIEVQLRSHAVEDHYTFEWLLDRKGQKRLIPGRRAEFPLDEKPETDFLNLQCVIRFRDPVNASKSWSHTLLVYYRLRCETAVQPVVLGSDELELEVET
jgi:hypothetical protein